MWGCISDGACLRCATLDVKSNCGKRSSNIRGAGLASRLALSDLPNISLFIISREEVRGCTGVRAWPAPEVAPPPAGEVAPAASARPGFPSAPVLGRAKSISEKRAPKDELAAAPALYSTLRLAECFRGDLRGTCCPTPVSSTLKPVSPSIWRTIERTACGTKDTC